MTLEIYEEAQELRSKMSHYADIRDALLNSVGHSMDICTTAGVPINSVSIREEDRYLINRLVSVLDEDIRTLREEFEKL